MRQFRLGITAMLAVYSIVLLASPEYWSFLDNINLPIHEAGHLLFAVFGDTMGLLGGTLLQLLVPIIFAAYFMTHADDHGASVAIWWLGQNCLNVSAYIGDAQLMELPLVGGGEHDWNIMLTQWGLLPSTEQLANLVRAFGVVLFVTALAWGALRAGDAQVRTGARSLSTRRSPVFARR
jgi:hypothetical protein